MSYIEVTLIVAMRVSPPNPTLPVCQPHGSCKSKLTYALHVGIRVAKLLAKQVVSPDEATHHALVIAKQQESLAARRWAEMWVSCVLSQQAREVRRPTRHGPVQATASKAIRQPHDVVFFSPSVVV